VTGVEGVPQRVELAKKLGFDSVVAPGDEALSQLMEISAGRGFSVGIDCSGVGAARHLLLEAAREWGRIVFVGEGGTVSFEPSPLLIHKQLALHGSWVCSIGQMEELVENLVAWKLHPEIIVTDKFNLNQAKEAYELFDSGQSGKVAIVMD
jgi:threonine dehydrogenase-like Zn-dependent dehydrogenase